MAKASSGWSGDDLQRVNLELTPDEVRFVLMAAEEYEAVNDDAAEIANRLRGVEVPA